ncbi:hypothetical protein P7K49_014963 [Saguinus oedipus]|uniref:Phosphofructokinase domain-containing protein n=1 Tax=Saguinus oedipus TaxID=9490 RepID=A0ABQ9V7V7_SAGOE|nr:hypothetical protein P7K49_014963 [Saguinus oedipus]
MGYAQVAPCHRGLSCSCTASRAPLGPLTCMNWPSLATWPRPVPFWTSAQALELAGKCPAPVPRCPANCLVLLLQAYKSVCDMAEARSRYQELCIPLCLVPATISNNVPGTEISLGSDTGLNALVQRVLPQLPTGQCPHVGVTSVTQLPGASWTAAAAFTLDPKPAPGFTVKTPSPVGDSFVQVGTEPQNSSFVLGSSFAAEFLCREGSGEAMRLAAASGASEPQPLAAAEGHVLAICLMGFSQCCGGLAEAGPVRSQDYFLGSRT